MTHRPVAIIMSTPLVEVDILFLLFPASAVSSPASHIVYAHFKEKY